MLSREFRILPALLNSTLRKHELHVDRAHRSPTLSLRTRH
jgi:hypothetical protein